MKPWEGNAMLHVNPILTFIVQKKSRLHAHFRRRRLWDPSAVRVDFARQSQIHCTEEEKLNMYINMRGLWVLSAIRVDFARLEESRRFWAV